MAYRYAKLVVRTTCAECGQPVPITTLGEQIACPYCSANNRVPRDLWLELARKADDRSEMGTGVDGGTVERGSLRVVYDIQASRPCCEKCGADLAVEPLADGERRDFACTQCGAPASTEPAPDWLNRSVPPARQVFAAGSQHEPAGAAALAHSGAAARPVCMECPRCGAGLEVTTSSERLFQCGYCDAQVYLPDDLWNRLHPIKKAAPFYLRFEGKSVSRERQERADRAEEGRRQQDARERQERATVTRDRARAAARAAIGSALVFDVMLGLCAAAGWATKWLGVPVPLALQIALAPLFVAGACGAMVKARRPLTIAVSGKNGAWDERWVSMQTWFYLLFALFVPAIGQILALLRAVALYRGRFGALSGSSNGSHFYYDELTLKDGEGRPAAWLFFGLALLGPMAVLAWLPVE